MPMRENNQISPLHCDLGGGNDSDDSFALMTVLQRHFFNITFSNMLTLPQEPCKIPIKHPKSSGRALSLEQQLAADDAKAKATARSN